MAGNRGRYDLLVHGPLCNLDIAFAEALSGQGLRCAVARSNGSPVDLDQLPAPLEKLSSEDILWYSKPRELLALCRRANLILTMAGSILSLRHWWLVPGVLPPTVNVAVGSDITELATRRTVRGMLYRGVLKRSRFVWMTPYPHALDAIESLGIQSLAFLRFPYLLPKERGRLTPGVGPITYLHATHIDWGETDDAPHRNSTKGTDRFLRAFINSVRSGMDLRCVILDRGADRHLARKLIKESGAGDAFEWRDPMSSSELRELVAGVDVVADQFDVGGFGAISMEAMAQGKPVLIWLDPTYVRLLYDEPPPALVCRTQQEIEKQIASWSEKKDLIEVGEESRAWVTKNHIDGPDLPEAVFRLRIAMRPAARDGNRPISVE